MTPRELIAAYLAANWSLTMWPASGDDKGPTEKDWPNHPRTLADYRDGWRVGVMTGTEVQPGKFLADTDLDWTSGAEIALALLPRTDFVFGRASKKFSHCFYTTDVPLVSRRFEDPDDKTCLLELRGTKQDGTIGLQTMIPPSVWSKNGSREILEFVRRESPAHVIAKLLERNAVLGAIGMLLGRKFGRHGFGHEPRLAWAGTLLRLGVTIDELEAMGKAISQYCENREISDVRRVLESTAAALGVDGKKVKGAPALAALIGKNSIERIRQWLGHDDDFDRDKNGNIRAKSATNIRRSIEKFNYTLAYDQFADQLLINNQVFEDSRVDAALLRIEHEHKYQPPVDYFYMVMRNLAHQNEFHPVRDYLDALKWDGQSRLDTWLITCAGAEKTVYTQAVSSILLIAAVKRVRSPGCKYDEMLILEGAQGIGKSTAFASLCPQPNWFLDDLTLNISTQKLIELTKGKWIVEASDMAGKRKTEVEQLKAMLSRQRDVARLSYAREPIDRLRHFVIVGTTNSTAYLNDPTGARRFWPIKITREVDTEWIVANRDQLWAEASMREARGDSIRLERVLWSDAAKQQEKRREIDPWEEIIKDLLDNIAASSDGRKRIVTADVWTALGIEPQKQDRYGANRISETMQRLGYERTRVRQDGVLKVGYRQLKTGETTDDIESEEDDLGETAKSRLD